MTQHATAATPLRAARPTIDTLTGIRAVAALWVLIEHFRFELYGLFPGAKHATRWINSGYLGVEVFFVLSGFIISYNYASQFTALARRGRAYWDFLVNRFARIYPVHLVTLLVVAGLVLAASVTGTTLNSAGKYTLMSFLANIVLLQALPDATAWNGPAWSISLESLAYAMFPVVGLLIARFARPRSAALAATGWLLAGTALMLLVGGEHGSPTSGTLMLLRIATEFVAGALLWKAWSTAGAPRGLRWDGYAALSVVATLVALAWVGGSETTALTVTPFLAAFVISCAGAAGPVGGLLASSVMQWGGRVSYSLYMTHFIVLMIVGKVLPWEHFAGSALPIRAALMLGYYAACVFAAWACYRLVERPGRTFVRHLAGHREARQG